MILNSLRMVNFRQHADTTIQFQRGLTGIVGTNGAGKSTVLEAIAFAFYGVASARGNKDSIKSRRAAKQASVRVELVFELAGHRYRVVRGLSMAECFLDQAESPIANSLSGVSELLSRILGMTRHEFFATYFTAQKDLAALATMSGPNRAKFLSRSMGFDQLATSQELVKDRRKAVVAEIAGIRSMLPDLDRVQSAIANATEWVQIATHKRRLAVVDNGQAIDALALIVPRWQSAQQTRERDQQLGNDIRLIDSQISTLTRDRDRLQQEVDMLSAARAEHDALAPQLAGLPALRAELAELDRIAAADVAQQQARGKIEALDAQIAQVSARLVAMELAQAEVDRAVHDQQRATQAYNEAMTEASNIGAEWIEAKATAKSTVDSLRSQYARLTERTSELLAKGADGSCNACGKPLGADWQASVDKNAADIAETVEQGRLAKERLAALETKPHSLVLAESKKVVAHDELRACDTRVQEARTVLGEKVRLSAEVTRLHDIRAEEQRKLDTRVSPYDAARHVAVRADLDKLANVDKRVAVLAGQLQREAPAQSELSQANDALTAAGARRLMLQNERDAIGFSEATFVALRAEHEAASTALQQSETAMITAKADEQRATDALNNANRDLERLSEAREKLTTLDTERLRLEALERAFTDLRAELNAKLRPELSAIASALLDVLTDGRYTEAEFDENYMLTLLKDGEAQPVISGGEEDLCNLVLRLAISQMIAARAGHAFSLLILDEVFGSMDENRRNNVVELLRSLSDRFEQVIVITHIDVSRGLDHVISVQYDEDLDCSVVTQGDAASVVAGTDRELLAAA